MAIILRIKSQGNHNSQFESQVFLLAKNRYFVISTFTMLKVEFKFRYLRVAKKR